LIQKNIKPQDANVFMILKLIFHSRTLLTLNQSLTHNKLGSVRQCHSQLLSNFESLNMTDHNVWFWYNP